MTDLALLALIGTAEAVVYQSRYRATHGTPRAAGVSTFAVCGLRVAFMALGVQTFMASTPWWAVILAYAVPASLVTAWARAREIGGASWRDKDRAGSVGANCCGGSRCITPPSKSATT